MIRCQKLSTNCITDIVTLLEIAAKSENICLQLTYSKQNWILYPVRVSIIQFISVNDWFLVFTFIHHKMTNISGQIVNRNAYFITIDEYINMLEQGTKGLYKPTWALIQLRYGADLLKLNLHPEFSQVRNSCMKSAPLRTRTGERFHKSKVIHGHNQVLAATEKANVYPFSPKQN